MPSDVINHHSLEVREKEKAAQRNRAGEKGGKIGCALAFLPFFTLIIPGLSQAQFLTLLSFIIIGFPVGTTIGINQGIHAFDKKTAPQLPAARVITNPPFGQRFKSLIAAFKRAGRGPSLLQKSPEQKALPPPPSGP